MEGSFSYYLVEFQASQQLAGDKEVNFYLVGFQATQQLTGDSGKLYWGRGVLLVIEEVKLISGRVQVL